MYNIYLIKEQGKLLVEELKGKTIKLLEIIEETDEEDTYLSLDVVFDDNSTLEIPLSNDMAKEDAYVFYYEQ